MGKSYLSRKENESRLISIGYTYAHEYPSQILVRNAQTSARDIEHLLYSGDDDGELWEECTEKTTPWILFDHRAHPHPHPLLLHGLPRRRLGPEAKRQKKHARQAQKQARKKSR